MTETFPITQRRIVEAKSFYADRTDKALASLEGEKYEAQFMPEIIDARISAPNDSPVWQNWYYAPSIRATGRTKQGVPVVVYAHVPNYFSKAENITKAIEQGLVKRAGKFPKDEFQKLLDLQDNERIFVVDYNKLKNSTSGAIAVKDAMKHPQTIPFLGGQARAEFYLPRHEQLYGKNIGNWHSDDLADEPLARLLFVGNNCNHGLSGNNYLDYSGRFLGVRLGNSRSEAQKISPNSEQLQKIISEYVAPVNQKELNERIDAIYR